MSDKLSKEAQLEQPPSSESKSDAPDTTDYAKLYRASNYAEFKVDRPVGLPNDMFPNRSKDQLKKLKKKYKKLLKEETEVLEELQRVLYAEGKHKVLVVFQAMDTGGKDSTIRAVFGPINPQGVRVQSFKGPTKEELAHDFLWRIHKHTPGSGMIQIFNRSHYEDVLIVKVKGWASEEQIEKRYANISNFEKQLADEGTVVLKFYLHISKDEQKRRLQARLDTPEKTWKFSKNDLIERKLWPRYQEVYNDALTACDKDFAPWYVIPGNHKWYARYVVAKILRQHLEALNMEYPDPESGLENVEISD